MWALRGQATSCDPDVKGLVAFGSGISGHSGSGPVRTPVASSSSSSPRSVRWYSDGPWIRVVCPHT